MRRAGGLDRLQAVEAADAVVDVDDEIALGEAGDVGQEIGRPARAPVRTHEPVAEHVLLADDRELVGLEALSMPQHGEPDLAGGKRAGGAPVGDRLQPGQPVVDEHLAHAVARAFAPAGEHDALAGLAAALDMADHGVEDVDVAGGPLGAKLRPPRRRCR